MQGQSVGRASGGRADRATERMHTAYFALVRQHRAEREGAHHKRKPTVTADLDLEKSGRLSALRDKAVVRFLSASTDAIATAMMIGQGGKGW